MESIIGIDMKWMHKHFKLWMKKWFIVAVILLCFSASVFDAKASDRNFLNQIPAYSGMPYVEVHGNKPYFKTKDKKRGVFEEYGKLDNKGRCTACMAMITKKLMPKEERGAIGNVRPSGWHTVKYPELISDRYLYNRCHIIGFQLTGENDNVNNLMTGTRYMNMEGMLPFENKVAECVGSGGKVLYRVTPVFDRDNLLASGVLMEAKSIGSEDVQFCVFCYNVQPGIVINYANGNSRVDEAYVAAHPEVLVSNQRIVASSGSQEYSRQVSKAASVAGSSSASGVVRNGDVSGSIPEGTTYVLNMNTHKFHYPSCSSVSDMAPHNTQFFSGTRDEALAQGFSPCGRCHP